MRLARPLRRSLERRHRVVVCQRAVALMTEYLEDALSAGDRARLEAHLVRCTACNAYLDHMRVTVAVLGHLEPDELPDRVLDELVELYRRVRAG